MQIFIDTITKIAAEIAVNPDGTPILPAKTVDTNTFTAPEKAIVNAYITLINSK